jgi:ABC-type dipeptide/oligopeptide/nickel transport system ATPase subunit
LTTLQWPAKPFSEFFVALIQELATEGVRYCILRNYEGFPTGNVGNDIDFMISASQLPRAIGALRSIQGIKIVGYTERHYLASVFLEGISQAPKARALQIDFELMLPWKGLPFLTTDAVLESAIPRVAGNATFFVPSPIHEAITSLFTSLVIGGQLKEKYFAKVQLTFASDRSSAIGALLPQFGLKVATRLVDSVIDGDRRKVLGCVRSLRASLALRCLLRRPARSVLAIVRHYANEFVFRFSPRTLETVSILGPDGGGKSTLTDTLIPLLRSAAVVVEKDHPPTQLSLVRASSEMTQGAEFHAQAPWSSLVSMAKVVAWLVEEWLNQFFGKRNLTLRITESCWCDLLAVPEKYRYGGPKWFVRLVAKLFPSPDLWIMLDPLADNLQSTNPEVQPAEIRRQLDVYRAFVKTRKRYVILDASQPADRVTESAYAAIIDTLAQRADKTLMNRFQQRKDTN